MRDGLLHRTRYSRQLLGADGVVLDGEYTTNLKNPVSLRVSQLPGFLTCPGVSALRGRPLLLERDRAPAGVYAAAGIFYAA